MKSKQSDDCINLGVEQFESWFYFSVCEVFETLISIVMGLESINYLAGCIVNIITQFTATKGYAIIRGNFLIRLLNQL